MTPLALLLPESRRWYPAVDIPALLLILCVALLPLRHIGMVRWTTQCFTIACCVWAMAIVRLVAASRVNARRLSRLIDWIIVAYLALLLIQQLCVLCGWPVFMASTPYDNPWKLDTLMSEPSHTVWVLSVLMFYRGLMRRDAVVEDKLKGGGIIGCNTTYYVWGAYLWICFSVPNASAFVLVPVALLPWLTRRNWAPIVGISASVILALCVFTDFAANVQQTRVSRLMTSIPSLDRDRIEEADPSAAWRINPHIAGVHAVGLTSADDWLGHGTDADRTHAAPPTSNDGNDEGDAGMFRFWYNYGFPAWLAMLALIGVCTLRRRRPLTIVMFLMALVVSTYFNTQLLWVILTYALTFEPRREFNAIRTIRK